jgi:type VI protein secretion system component VasF
MNEDLNYHSIKQLLNQSSDSLAPATLEKLRQARLHALEHQKARRSAPVLAWLGHHGHHGDSQHTSRRTHWAAALLLLACLFSGYAYWQSCSTDHDTSDVDIAILTDDVPLPAYVE